MRKGLSKSMVARVLGAAPKYTIAQLEEKYPPRGLPDGAMVTRFAPSPTGFMHIGNLYGMMIDKKMAQQSGGVFMLRIEDTDTKRGVRGAVQVILDAAGKFGLSPDEGPFAQHGGENKSACAEDADAIGYGPYVQSMRRDIYHSVAADLLARGDAYPCFLTQEEMDEIRARQKAAGAPTGIYGEWARDRDMSEADIAARLDAGGVPSIRLYSAGNPAKKIYCMDAARGSIAFPENNEDAVLVKSSDGLPTYHFAHLVDDHFMRTTHVVRGEEWLPSLPLHAQLFGVMGWAPPAYVHTSTLDKIDSETGKQRKLSKRKDPEANVAGFVSEGWPAEAVLEYLFNIAASGYEEAKAKNPNLDIWNYDLKIKKLPASGALFDWDKLAWWAREFIATLSVDELARRVAGWAEEYESRESVIAGRTRDKDYLRAILSIERDNPKRVRKDFITWKQTLEEIGYFFDDDPEIGSRGADKNVLSAFLRGFDANDDKDAWWGKIQAIASDLGIKNGDAAMSLRIALTGRDKTPDLYSIMRVMGAARVRRRIEAILAE
jgi:glutamyl-tRNA synthetase